MQSSRQIQLTDDGSHTILLPEQNITYHSGRGAIQESQHVFIAAGLLTAMERFGCPVNVFEMGFGTGLNAFLTTIEADALRRNIQYTVVEKYPLTLQETTVLNYPKLLQHADWFQNLHTSDWSRNVQINAYFSLNKYNTDLLSFETDDQFHVVYYDAFAPNNQPELWTQEVFEQLYGMMHHGGILTTYCSKSIVRRALLAAGFTVKKVPGPPGKREMLVAEKPA